LTIWSFRLSFDKIKRLKKGITYRGMIAVMLLSVYLFNPFKLYTPYISYKINYNYIANVLCENKDKPEMNCNGKCHLKKELKKTAEEESQKKDVQLKGMETEEAPARQIKIAYSPTLIFENNLFPFYTEDLISVSLKNSSPPPKI
jgi:hypothetical protein